VALDFDAPTMAVMREAPHEMTEAARTVGPIVRRHELPGAYVDILAQAPRGRSVLDAAHPVQWEGDVMRYQAATVARGHILEHRVRWRANGYSLGTVAKTLTLAPRQIKRVQKVEWERAERTRREERTQLVDRVQDVVTRERGYEDEVRANLVEWARGESSSSQSAAAGGFGFAGPGFVIGGGGGASHATSSSSQEGGRAVSAAEEQRLRDEVRRYGDALRRFESVVVNEVTQEETVTGTTEVVRNPNYGHALTIIYHQILRHLRVETAFAGVRECLFVPFAMRPFTLERAYRWRETVQRALRDRRHAVALTYLRDVMTNFVNSDVPAGRRMEQPVRHLHGSLYLTLGIERPRDDADGNFDEAAWAVLRPFLGVPALSIYNRLRALADARRDRAFQDEQAPRIAATWVDRLELSAGGQPLAADFTLASRYSFNGRVRVDFTVAAPLGVTRQTLTSLEVKATRPLPPGSVANLTRVNYTYQTDHFERSVAMAQTTDDLVVVETGAVDTLGATTSAQPDLWERKDLRADMTRSVQELVQHLNEHLEHYHKAIWWHMDRDRLFMLIDGFYVPRTDGVSIASVVERDPIAILGNAIVFRVSAGSFLGLDDLTTPAALHNYYAGQQVPRDPMHVSLPTDGLYAQVVMDECLALEEHHGNTDWVLGEPDPELPTLAAELLASRRAEPVPATPTPLPQTIINLQNAPEAPPPSGLAGVLSAVTNAGAFRDMAGLAGTQANAAAALHTASQLATSFGAQAAALKLAELAAQAEATRTADQKIASVDKAKQKKLVNDEEAADHTNKILDQLHAPAFMPPADGRALMDTLRENSGRLQSLEASNAQGNLKLGLTPAAFPTTMAALIASSRGYGTPDSIPNHVFVVKDASTPPDPFLANAVAFHKQWGLKVHEVSSLQQVVERLARTSTKVPENGRIRIVTHADDELGLPLFTGMDPDDYLDQGELDAFLVGDAALLAVQFPPMIDLDTAVGSGTLWQHIATQLAGTATATAFGLSTTTAPTGPLASFMQRRIDRIVAGSAGFPASDATAIDNALAEILRDLGTQLQADGRTAAEVRDLGVDIAGVVSSLTPAPTMTALDPMVLAALRATLKVAGSNFRTSKLVAARKKLKDKWIDIRGCSIGKNQTFLQALARFFGTPKGVTAPDWYIGWPGLNYQDEVLHDASEFATAVDTNPALAPQMDWWAQALFPSTWATVSTRPEKVDLFFKEFFAKDLILPVYNVDYTIGATESLTLYRPDTTASMENWLVSLWGKDLNGKVASLRDAWDKRSVIPFVPAVSKHLTIGSAADPQSVSVLPDRDYQAHIKST
jgi:hypothetical protein